MEATNYKLPLRFSTFFHEDGGRLSKCTELESIDQYLEMILTTCPGEHTYNVEFGTKIWELDFERVVSQDKWEEEFAGYVKEAVLANERRISNVTVSIKVNDVLREDNLVSSVTIRKRVDIRILGVLNSTGQNCGFGYTLYLGPLSNE